MSTMALPLGKRLGPYEIKAVLGAGGMGEVYRALDTRLNRTVALKVMLPSLSEQPEFRLRFEREARAVSILSHPHIAALFDIGHQDGIDFLVMEFVDGETLAERLKKGPLPVEQVLRVAVQIAEALDKSHRAGIVHRDLKPQNIMMTKEDVKVLDFGLAKLNPLRSDGAISPDDLKTQSYDLTAKNTLLGTIPYMAPEQLEGKPSDERTDIFALGAVLYEMAAGRKAFEGDSQAGLIAAILDHDPPSLSQRQPLIPPALERLVKKCLAKDPDDRWQSARDIADELKWIGEEGSRIGIPAPTIIRRRNRERAAWLTAAAALTGFLIMLISALMPVRQRILPPSTSRFGLRFSEDMSFTKSGVFPALSPDGRHIVFSAVVKGIRKLWKRDLNTFEAQPVPETEGVSSISAFWSPDSRFIGFLSDGKLQKTQVDGGGTQVICAVDFLTSTAAWGSGNVLIVSQPDGLSRVSAAGGPLTPLTKLNPAHQEISHNYPCFLPDGRHFLYYVASALDEYNGVYLGSLDSDRPVRLIGSKTQAVYAAPGFLLTIDNGRLLAQPFDPGSLRLKGEPFMVTDQAASDSSSHLGYFSVSQNGLLVIGTKTLLNSQLAWYDRSGKALGVAGPPAMYRFPVLSPDEKRIAVEMIDPGTRTGDIWLLDSVRNTRTRFTFDPARESDSVWSPDGRQIAYASERNGRARIYQKPADGSGQEELVLDIAGGAWPLDWTKDGRFLLFTQVAQKNLDIGILPLSGPKKPASLFSTQRGERSCQVSPDGRWLAYSSPETGRYEIYVQAFPALGEKVLISTDGGNQPLWSRDGRELFYIAPDRMLQAVRVQSGSVFESGPPNPMFRVPDIGDLVTKQNYCAASDGRFLFNALQQSAQDAPMVVIMNWAAEPKH
jgi:serine/threonine protein kinase